MSDYDPTDLMAIDAADDNRNVKARLSKDTEEGDLKWLMSSKRGRRIVWRLLESAGVFRNSFNTNALQMAFAEGHRNYGNRILAIIHTHCPDLYPQMAREQKEKENE